MYEGFTGIPLVFVRVQSDTDLHAHYLICWC